MAERWCTVQLLKFYKSVIYLNADSDKNSYICAGDVATRLNFMFMQLQIKVFMNVSALSGNSSCFERLIECHDDLQIPFESLVKDMKFLYGSSCVVSFNVQ